MSFLDKDLKKGDGLQSIESYEAAFTEIEEITGSTDINEIVSNFIQGLFSFFKKRLISNITFIKKIFFSTVEDSNFALFNYVNEQNNEIERLQDIIEGVTKFTELKFIFIKYFLL